MPCDAISTSRICTFVVSIMTDIDAFVSDHFREIKGLIVDVVFYVMITSL